MKLNARFIVAFSFSVVLAHPAQARVRVRDFTPDGKPNVRSGQAIAMLLPSGEILFEKDADTVRPIASLSKIVSAITIQDECKLDPNGLHEMTVENRLAAKGGDKTRLTTGWQFSHRDLMHAALLRSDNRAMPALVEACGLSIPQFAIKMNEKVKSWGLTKTHFAEPNGLSPENTSTAREYAMVLREVQRYPDLVSIMQTEKTVITGYRNGRARPFEIRSTDRLLARESVDMIGGKTGYTDLAKYCFAGLARISDTIRVAMVFLNGEGKHTRFADFMRVHKWISGQREDLMARLLPGPVRAFQAQHNTLMAAPEDKNQMPMPVHQENGGMEIETKTH